jgi:hypothetical protein
LALVGKILNFVVCCSVTISVRMFSWSIMSSMAYNLPWIWIEMSSPNSGFIFPITALFSLGSIRSLSILWKSWGWWHTPFKKQPPPPNYSIMGWECCSVVGHLPTMFKALGSIPRATVQLARFFWCTHITIMGRWGKALPELIIPGLWVPRAYGLDWQTQRLTTSNPES